MEQKLVLLTRELEVAAPKLHAFLKRHEALEKYVRNLMHIEPFAEAYASWFIQKAGDLFNQPVFSVVKEGVAAPPDCFEHCLLLKAAFPWDLDGGHEYWNVLYHLWVLELVEELEPVFPKKFEDFVSGLSPSTMLLVRVAFADAQKELEQALYSGEDEKAEKRLARASDLSRLADELFGVALSAKRLFQALAKLHTYGPMSILAGVDLDKGPYITDTTDYMMPSMLVGTDYRVGAFATVAAQSPFMLELLKDWAEYLSNPLLSKSLNLN